MILQGRDRHPWLHLWIAVGLVATGLLLCTSHLGGDLVFEHGVGVRAGAGG